jgi:catechol 2,3-dioxygenase-like lactoylglutathione lyase family enzyme
MGRVSWRVDAFQLDDYGDPMSITGLSHVYLKVRDVDEAIDFYTSNLGFRLLRKYTVRGMLAAYVELGGILLELGTIRDTTLLPGPDGERKLGLRTTDIDAIFAQLRRNGVNVLEEPRPANTFWGRQGAIKDPSGYIITLREWEAPDSPSYADWEPRHEYVSRLA